jgi:hypothetical protein
MAKQYYNNELQIYSNSGPSLIQRQKLNMEDSVIYSN